jgi:hypothetical protein
MRTLLLVVAVLLPLSTGAQPVPESTSVSGPITIPESVRMPDSVGVDTTEDQRYRTVYNRFVSSATGSVLMVPQGLKRAVGSRTGGIHISLELRTPSGYGIGLEMTGSNMGVRTESFGQDRRAKRTVKRELALTRVSLFGQYGPRFGTIRPYGEVLLGLNVLGTITKIRGPDDDTFSEKADKNAVAPAAGIGVGIELALPSWIKKPLVLPRSALRVEGRHVLGGRANYLAFSGDGRDFAERTSSTGVSSLSVGLTCNF